MIRVRWRRRLAPCAAVAALFTAGCTAPGASVASAYQSRLVAMPIEDAFDAAVPIMREHFGRVVLDRPNWTIDAPPTMFQAALEAGAGARELLGARGTLRRSATLRLRPREGGTAAEVRVDIERREAGRSPAGPPASRLSDSPAQTPMDRDAAITERQQAAWIRVRRDLRAERDVLDALRDLAAAHNENRAATRPGS